MVRYSELTAISVLLEWDAVVPVTDYIVEYRTSAQPSWSDARRLPPTTSTMSQLQGLEANTQYIVRVIILNNCTLQVTPEMTLTTGCELAGITRTYCYFVYRQISISSICQRHHPALMPRIMTVQYCAYIGHNN